MAISTMGYMVPVEVAERQKAINRDLAAGFSFDEASRRNDPNHVPYPKKLGGPRPVTDYGPMSPAYINAPAFDVESAPEPAWVTEHKKRSAQFDSPGMSLADLFDNRLWETYEVDAAPKRGGTVERRRYIGKNPMTMEFAGVDYGPTQSGGNNQNVAPEFRSDGYPREDHLAERFRNRDTRGPVTLYPVDSLDKQDMLDVAGRVGKAPEPPGPSWWESYGKTGIEYGKDAWDATSGFAGDVNRKISEIDQTPAAAAAASTIGDVRDSFDPKWLQDLLRGKVDEYDNWLADRYRNVDDSARWLRGNAERLDHEFEAPEALTNTAGVNPMGTIATAGLGFYDYLRYLMGLKPGFHIKQTME